MSDDRRLDAALARALGWEERPHPQADECPGLTYWVDPNGYAQNGVPAYSSTWDGLGLVVEAMRGKGYAFRLTTKSEQFMWAYFGPLRGIGKEGFAGDSYAPRAVALAAYQALTGKRWEKGEHR
jgi:hypothetical protein